jgi:hypothetical protein
MLNVTPFMVDRKAAAKTAAPQPPKTSQKVPKNSAAARFESGIGSPALSCGVIFLCEEIADRAREIDGTYTTCKWSTRHPMRERF